MDPPSQTASNSQLRCCIQRIELKSTKKFQNKICARLLIDGEVVHKLPSIKKGQPLVWHKALFCSASPSSTFLLKVHEESYLGFRRTPKYRYEFPASEIQKDQSNQLIVISERASNNLSVSISFSDPEIALPAVVAAIQNTRPQHVLDRLGQLRSAVQKIVETGTTVSEVIPITKPALSLLEAAWKKLEERSQCEETVEKLIVGFADILTSILPVKGMPHSEDIKKTITDLFRLIQEASGFIVDYRSETGIRRLRNISFSQDQAQIFLDQLQRLKEKFDRDLRVQESVDRMNEELSKLKPAGRCTHHHRTSCLAGTRTTLIAHIDEWIKKKDGTDKLLWLNGLAGLGKSSIAASLCQLLQNRFMLGASFFCRRDDPDLRDSQRVMSTIIYQLARHYLEYRTRVITAIRNDPGLCDLPTGLQYDILVKAILTELNSKVLPTSTFIVIVDAIEECEPRDSHKQLLSNLLGMSQLVPWLKVIVTSRPDHDIKEFFDKLPESSLKRVDVREYDASEDIYTFLREQLIAKSNDEIVFDDSTIRLLKERSAGLFIWAETACRFILKGFSPQARLKEVLNNSAVEDATKQLDVLYSIALKRAMADAAGDNLELLKRCIGLVVATGHHTALSVPNLEKLLSYDDKERIYPGVLSRVVNALGSVLYEDRSDGSVAGQGAIRVCHPSFADYIITPSRSEDLCVDLAEQDAILSICCLKTMLKELKFNICGLETSHMLNKDVPRFKSRVDAAIPPHLSYSCQYWVSHITAADSTCIDMTLLNDYLFGRALFYWIEALSLLEKLDVAISMLLDLTEWNRCTEVCAKCVNDAYRFILSFYDTISQSTPHLYLSALPFAPEESGLVQRGRKWFPNTLKLVAGAQKDWTTCLRTIPHPTPVMCLALSHDGRRIASGSRDWMVRVWNAETGVKTSGLLAGHSDLVCSVAFSPDDQRVVSGSWDKTARIWDVETGVETCGPLVGHSDLVCSVAFSHDGQCIVSGSWDKTVRVWDVKTGTAVSSSLVEHSSPVLSVAFSPHDQRVAFGSWDKTVQIWNTETGRVAKPLLRHSAPVLSIAFSPDGRRIVSGSWDRTVRVWNSETGMEESGLLARHSAPVLSVALSPDGQQIASGSWGKTVQLWNTESDASASMLFAGHSAPVLSVAFSPKGQHIISGSQDKTVRIWGAKIGAEAFEPQVGHHDLVCSVAYSPDGTCIVSGSHDSTVRIWHPETGVEVSAPLVGHSAPVLSVAFSPDGEHIISGSVDKTIRIWNAKTGVDASKPLVGHSDLIYSVAYSPDGKRIASGSHDHTVRLWNTEKDAEVSTSLIGHSAPVLTVAFSPNSQHVISGSHDQTIRIWDIGRGTEVSTLRGHSAPVHSVIFSRNGRRIVSGSWDKTVRIWDANTGAGAFALLNHSSPVLSISISPDQRHIVSGCWDKTVRVWDIETGAEVLSTPLIGHSAPVLSVAFSPDGRHIASGSRDKTMRIWRAKYEAKSELPVNISRLTQFMAPTGWISRKDTPFLLRVPVEYERTVIDDSLFCISHEPVPAPVVIDLSNFTHGDAWALVKADSD